MRDSPEYQAEMKQWGIGSTSQKVAQTVGSILTGLVTGNAGQAVAGGLNPWAAQLIKKETTDASGNVDVATNAMAHAVWGAVSSQMSGGSAAAGAAGAFSGELATRYIAEKYWGADTPEKIAALGQEDREQLSLLGTLAAGLAGGMAGNSSAAATSGAVAGKNAVENNALGAAAGSDLGFWFGKTPDCDTACKAGIAKGVAEGNLVVSAGVAGVAGGAMIVGATPEIVAAAKAALEGCKAAPTICLNNAGLQVAEAVTPGGIGAAGAIGVGKTAVEATAAKVEAVAANAAKNTGKGTFSNISENVAFSSKQLDKKFKHAGDFGVITTKKNSETIAQYQTAIKSHLYNKTTYEHGTYLLVPESKVFFNPQTNNVVVIDKSGSFVSGWKLDPTTKQYENFIKNGTLR